MSEQYQYGESHIELSAADYWEFGGPDNKYLYTIKEGRKVRYYMKIVHGPS